MKMLMCSKLSNRLIGSGLRLIVRVATLSLLFSFSAHAQENTNSKPQPDADNPSIKRPLATELPAPANQPDTPEKKPGFVRSVIDRFRNNDLPGDLQIHGFVTQAYIATSDNNVFGGSDNGGSFGLTEAGLNASIRPLPRLQLSAQVLSRRAGAGNSGTPRLDYAVLDYRLYSQETNQLGIRVGRIKNPFGFYNETRDVAFTRPSILLPQSIYFDRTRNLGLSSDSVQLYSDTAVFDWGTLSTQFGVSLPIVNDKDTESSLLGGVRPGKLEREVGYIGRGIFETNDKRLRLGVSGIWLNTSYDPNHRLGDPIGPGALRFTPVIFSAQYNAERWTLTSEYAIRPFKYNNNFRVPALNGLDFIGESYYFQGEYRFTPKIEGILRYDALFIDRSDRDGSRWAAQNPARHGLEHSRFARDITVGLRWNVTPEFMLRAEFHHVNGTGWLSRLDNPVAKDTEENWNLYGIQASYRF
ncbi:hypothetical protein [Nitrosomonas sp.]|uniref:hypothetical protein n=1 Tax=Nitrosomonas sp. TaxID=42353 RepID=UPI001D2308E8|nr:hypothetical protein [Nitrosomonas sp.]MBX3615957.1 hypothetical protein [Nitrosomonas sp.]